MTNGKLALVLAYSVCFCSRILHAYFDNRYLFPFNQHITWRTPQKRSCLNANIFFMTANKGLNEHGDDIQLPAIGGVYDVAKINKAMNLVGITNPLYLSEWTTDALPYKSYGKLHATGIEWWFEYALTDHLSIGADTALMHVSTQRNECITDEALTNLVINRNNDPYTGRERSLELARLNAQSLLNINTLQWSATGLSDSEIYLRYGLINDYSWKVRQYDLSLTLGGIFPTGQQSFINAPTSIPFGDNGHWGLYIKGDANFELTDDIYFGTWLYTSKRFAKTYPMRVPMCEEPLSFGALITRTYVQPGWLIGVSPYIIVDDIQDGFGAYAAYTYLHHFKTNYCCRDTSYTPNLCRLQTVSNWTNEYFTIGVDYDRTKTAIIREYGPRLFFEWTWPTDLFGSKWVSKTYRISLGVEFHF